jgi:DMSO/TMAO reductase YedYZ molybdopterin-dependent catalytic subunit
MPFTHGKGNNGAVAGRRTNLALLVLLAWALATGGLAFAIGQGWNRWISVAHGVGGLAVVLLAPWKSVVARRGLRRRRPGRAASIALSAVVALALASGVAHATGLLVSAGGITAIQVHVGAALASAPLALWHVAARRIRPRRTDLSRRVLLRSAALAAGSAAAYGAVAGLTAVARLPGRSRRFTGSYQTGSGRPEAMPVTQWLNDSVPDLDQDAWRLSVVGSGRGRLTLAELDQMREPVRAILDCTGGWFAEQVWEGVRLDRLLSGEHVGAPGWRSVVVTSVTGYSRRFPASDLSSLWLATRVGGRPLSPGHGFPARLVAPGRRGFWWVKWVVGVEASSTPWWWQPPFPVT